MIARSRPLLIAQTVVGVAILVVVGVAIKGGSDAQVPSCSWTARISGADSDQAGLIRCYLRAVAERSPSLMRMVARGTADGGPTGFTAADFADSRAAGTGTPVVTVTGNPSDSADATVAIRYADGTRDHQEIHLADPTSSHSWRFWDIGTYPPVSGAPSAAQP